MQNKSTPTYIAERHFIQHHASMSSIDFVASGKVCRSIFAVEREREHLIIQNP